MADRMLVVAVTQSQPISAVTDSPALNKIEDQIATLTAAFAAFKVHRGCSHQKTLSGSSSRDSSTRLCFYHKNFVKKGTPLSQPLLLSPKRLSQVMQATTDPGGKPCRLLFFEDPSTKIRSRIDTGANPQPYPTNLTSFSVL